jgi:hypothetical protein
MHIHVPSLLPEQTQHTETKNGSINSDLLQNVLLLLLLLLKLTCFCILFVRVCFFFSSRVRFVIGLWAVKFTRKNKLNNNNTNNNNNDNNNNNNNNNYYYYYYGSTALCWALAAFSIP